MEFKSDAEVRRAAHDALDQINAARTNIQAEIATKNANRVAEAADRFRARDAAERADTPMANDPDYSYGDAGPGTGLFAAISKAGYHPNDRPRVQVSYKAIMSDASDANITQEGGVVTQGRDDRFAYTAFPIKPLGDATAVQVLRQTARSLAAPEDMDISLTGSSEKPVSTITAALQTVDAVMIAHVSEYIPNAVFLSSAFAQFVREEMSFGLSAGIDDNLIDELTGASGTTTHSQASTTLFETYRNAIKTARAAGYRPTLGLLHPNDAADLDLLQDGVDHFYGAGPQGAPGFGSLWGLRIVESNAVTEGLPVLVDVERFGAVYLGGAMWATDSATEFSTNRTRARLETSMAVAIRQAAAIVEITLA